MTMPMDLHPQYIIDENGNKTSVVLPIEEFEDIQNMFKVSQRKITNIDLSNLQINSMISTWDNEKDEGWDEL